MPACVLLAGLLVWRSSCQAPVVVVDGGNDPSVRESWWPVWSARRVHITAPFSAGQDCPLSTGGRNYDGASRSGGPVAASRSGRAPPPGTRGSTVAGAIRAMTALAFTVKPRASRNIIVLAGPLPTAVWVVQPPCNTVTEFLGRHDDETAPLCGGILLHCRYRPGSIGVNAHRSHNGCVAEFRVVR